MKGGFRDGGHAENEKERVSKTHTHDDKEDCEHGESHELDRLPAPVVDEQERGIVSRDEARDGEDDVPDADIMQAVVDPLGPCAFGASKPNGREDNR